jgi:hypothetical protein
MKVLSNTLSMKVAMALVVVAAVALPLSSPAFSAPATSEPLSVPVPIPMGLGRLLPPPLPGEDVLFAKAALPGYADQVLVRVDHRTTPGLSEIIGEIGFYNINSMDFDPLGDFYAVGSRSGLPGVYLIKIDPQTGLGARIGGPVTGVSASMASDELGDLYGASDASDALYFIDKTTGLSRLIGPFGYNTTHQGMDFNPSGALYLLSRSVGPNTSPTLLSISKTTGRAAIACTLRLDTGAGFESLYGRTSSYDMSFSSEGTLYASMVIDGESWLITVDPATGISRKQGIMRIPNPNGGWWRVDSSSLAFGPVEWANIPPVAIINAPAFVEATLVQGAYVQMDGLQSHDPDSSGPLTYTWFNTAMEVIGTEVSLTVLLPMGDNLITLNVMDPGGKIGSETAIVRVSDSIPPTIVCPNPMTVDGNTIGGIISGDMMVQFFLAGAQAYDTIDPAPRLTNNLPRPVVPLGANIVTFTARDFSGNSASCQSTLRVIDRFPPAIVCPPPADFESPGPNGLPGSDPAFQAWLAGASASDMVDPSPVITSDAPEGYMSLGPTDVTFTATDHSSNSAWCYSVVTVVDRTPPRILCPGDLVVEAQGPAGVPKSDGAIRAFLASPSASDLVDLMPAITNDAPDYFALGPTVVTFTATDYSGNGSQCQATVTVADRTPPRITPPADLALEAPGPNGVPASDARIRAFLAGAGATDLVDPAPTLTHDAPAAWFPLGVTVVTFTATDRYGNRAQAQARVTVADTTPPALVCPPDLTVDAQGPSGVPVSDGAILAFLAGASASDAVDPAPVITNNAPAAFFPLGETAVTFTARDASGNSAQCQANVTVVDRVPPSILCPRDIVLEAQGPNGVPASDGAIQTFLAGASASDVADPAPVITNDAPAAFFPLGETVVTLTARDASGNSAQCQAKATIVDTLAPVIVCPPALTIEGLSPDGVPTAEGAIQAFLAGAGASDLVDPAPAIGHDAPARFFPLGSTTVTFRARDASGNVASCRSSVDVVDTTSPTLVCPDPIQILLQEPDGVPTTAPEILEFLAGAQADDLCDPEPVITHDAPAAYFPLGTTAVTFTARDRAGNRATCRSTVKVVESTCLCVGPVIVTTPVPVGVEAFATAHVSHPGPFMHKARWDWGEGTQTDGVVVETGGVGNAEGRHAYGTPGMFKVRVTVQDQFGIWASDRFKYLIVYDPAAGYVTGSGWVNTPAGAVPAPLAVEGRAPFSFAARYEAGAVVPAGSLQFQFPNADLRLEAPGLDWLIVSGAGAKIGGFGTISGGGGEYAFIATVYDGAQAGRTPVPADAFRIKIWERATGRVAYDNLMGKSDDAWTAPAILAGDIVLRR